MKPKTDNLFHFTRSLNVLKLILSNGIYPRYSLEESNWLPRRDPHEEREKVA